MGDQISGLLSPFLHTQRINALKHVRRFDWEIVSEMYSRVIRRAIAGRGRE